MGELDMKRGPLADCLESPCVFRLEASRQDDRQTNATGRLQPLGLAKVFQDCLRTITLISIEDRFDLHIARGRAAASNDIDQRPSLYPREAFKKTLGQMGEVAHVWPS